MRVVAAKPILCKSLVRKGDGSRAACGTLFNSKERCPKRDAHIMKLKTGYCSNGWHEGEKATGFGGDPVPTCKMILTCPCTCHDKLDKLYHMSGMERLPVDVSGYTPKPRTFWLPSDDPLPALSSPSGTTAPRIIESAVPGRVAPRIERDFAPTPSGRAARGELEAWVLEQCDVWVIDEEDELCTPAMLATRIGREQGINPPSVGAINAIFERWIKLEFARIEKRPTRFVGYTEEGVRLGLEGMKIQAKRMKARQKADQNRGAR